MLSGEAANTNFIVFGLTLRCSNQRSTTINASTILIYTTDDDVCKQGKY